MPGALEASNQDALIGDWFSENLYERPSDAGLARLIGAAERDFERRLFKQIVGRLNGGHCARLMRLMETEEGISDFSRLRADTGAASLDNVLKTIDRLELLRALDLPDGLLSGLHPKLVDQYRMRAGAEDVWEMRRHPKIIRLERRVRILNRGFPFGSNRDSL